MNRKVLFIACTAALATGACDRKSAAPADPDIVASYPPEPSVPMPATVSGAQAFANAAAAGDAFEVASSRLAASRAAAARVKQFAAQMVAAHTQSTANLAAAGMKAQPSITPDPTLTEAQQRTLDGLESKSGTDFDAAYIAAQVSAHQQALDLLNGYATSGNDPALKTFAAQLAPTVKGHLDMADAL